MLLDIANFVPKVITSHYVPRQSLSIIVQWKSTLTMDPVKMSPMHFYRCQKSSITIPHLLTGSDRGPDVLLHQEKPHLPTRLLSHQMTTPQMSNDILPIPCSNSG